MDPGLNLNPDVPSGIAQGCGPSGELPRVRIGQRPGCTSQYPCSLGQPRTVSRNQLCQPAASLLPARARQHLGGKGREISHREKLNVPGKGTRAHQPVPVPALSHSLQISQAHRSAPARTSLAEFWLLLFPPCHLALGTVGSPASYCFGSGGSGTCKSQLQTLALYPLAAGGGARCLPQRGWEGKLTFSAKIGLPESSVRCKNSKCRDPNSARMLLLPAVAQPQLPLKRHQLRHPAGSCGTGWCLLCTGHLSQSSWAPLCGYH